mmetsp:Transcript_37625/g.61219  ORF Transcript_37625/g.61219 Transcript_37625/m.61219 type:complete len:202 (-) Transcript_37625:2527-3132(-)
METILLPTNSEPALTVQDATVRPDDTFGTAKSTTSFEYRQESVVVCLIAVQPFLSNSFSPATQSFETLSSIPRAEGSSLMSILETVIPEATSIYPILALAANCSSKNDRLDKTSIALLFALRRRSVSNRTRILPLSSSRCTHSSNDRRLEINLENEAFSSSGIFMIVLSMSTSLSPSSTGCSCLPTTVAINPAVLLGVSNS